MSLRPARLVPLVAVALAGCGPAPHTAIKTAHDPHAPFAVAVKINANVPSKREIAALFDDWNQTLQTGGPNDVAELYAEDAIVEPTDSNAIRTNRVEIANFISDFQTRRPRATVNEQHIDVLSSTTAINSGICTFDIIREGQPDFMVTRYSFVYEKIGGKWLIKSQHASAMPDQVNARPPPLATLVAENVPPAAPTAPAASAPEPAAHAAHEKPKTTHH